VQGDRVCEGAGDTPRHTPDIQYEGRFRKTLRLHIGGHEERYVLHREDPIQGQIPPPARFGVHLEDRHDCEGADRRGGEETRSEGQNLSLDREVPVVAHTPGDRVHRSPSLPYIVADFTKQLQNNVTKYSHKQNK